MATRAARTRHWIRPDPRAWACLVLPLALGCGHAIGPGLDFGAPDARFDFRKPPACADTLDEPGSAAPDDVVVRYLGAGGLYVGWRGAGLLTSPYFSNPGTSRVLLGRMRIDTAAVERGLAGVPVESVGAVLVGHSHYDHLGDLPAVAELAPGATLWVNRSGAQALRQPFPALGPRLRRLDEAPVGQWIQLEDAVGGRLPFRVLPVPSMHAPHVLSLTLWKGDTPDVEKAWDGRRHGSLGAGSPFAFVIDLLESGEPDAAVRFRLYAQDSATEKPLGLPPAPVDGDAPYDLAVLCMASTQWVEGHPEDLLRLLRPRHVLVTHYENFMRPWGPRRGFVPLLTRGVANGFLRRAIDALEEVPPARPLGTPCGPSAPHWTMPLTGEWLAFRTAP